jgi:hypothetical protein
VGSGTAGARTRRLTDADVARQAGRLEHRSDATTADGLARGLADERRLARTRLEQPKHQADGSGLAGAVGSEQRDGLAGLDGQVDTVECDDVAEATRHAVEADGRPG